MAKSSAHPGYRTAKAHVASKVKVGPSSVPGPKAGPNGSFPIGDPTHARLAIGGATRSYNAGNIPKAMENSIKAKARSALAKGSK